MIVDYSGGTGILTQKLFGRTEARCGVIIVDSSPKFLRTAITNLGSDPRVAFRLLGYDDLRRRLQHLDEVLDRPILDRGLDAIVSTNAVHLYPNLLDTFRAWARASSIGTRVFIQSGNIGLDGSAPCGWIINDTIDGIHRRAVEIVRQRKEYATYAQLLDDARRMDSYASLRNRYFLSPRSRKEYCSALGGAGFSIDSVTIKKVDVSTDEWFESLSLYHEGILGWIGGTKKIDGQSPTSSALRDRLEIMREALSAYFCQRPVTQACWTHISGTKR